MSQKKRKQKEHRRLMRQQRSKNKIEIQKENAGK
jgi:hypothetical protein